jgi:hypothetical protein
VEHGPAGLLPFDEEVGAGWHDAAIDFDAAAGNARQLDLGRRRKREHLREGRRPLPPRDG